MNTIAQIHRFIVVPLMTTDPDAGASWFFSPGMLYSEDFADSSISASARSLVLPDALLLRMRRRHDPNLNVHGGPGITMGCERVGADEEESNLLVGKGV